MDVATRFHLNDHTFIQKNRKTVHSAKKKDVKKFKSTKIAYDNNEIKYTKNSRWNMFFKEINQN